VALEVAKMLPNDRPSVDDLASAPAMDNWSLRAFGHRLAVVGPVSSSQKFRDGSNIRTSEFRAIDHSFRGGPDLLLGDF
jgi:hypothetical protein